MRIAALSDLHVGRHSRTDAFGHEPACFDRFVAGLLDAHDRVVFLGDVFVADHAWAWGRRFARAELKKALAAAPWLADRLADPRVHYVHGNHDLAARDVLGAAEQLVLGDARFPILFVHGHQFDPIANRALWLANLGTWTTGRIRAMGLASTAQWFEDRDVELKDQRFRGPKGPYAQAANVLCQRARVSAVVMGHTHAARADRVEHGWSLNTGTCSTGRLEYVSIDTARGCATCVIGDRKTAVDLGVSM